MTKELSKFKKHFEITTGIKVDGLEEQHLPSWKRLILPPLNLKDLNTIEDYINKTFQPGTSYMKRINSYKGYLVLNANVNEISDNMDIKDNIYRIRFMGADKGLKNFIICAPSQKMAEEEAADIVKSECAFIIEDVGIGDPLLKIQIGNLIND